MKPAGAAVAGPPTYSVLGDRIWQGSGIDELMQDLADALGGDHAGETLMLGGGQPAAIPQLQQVWRESLAKLLENQPERVDRMLGVYDPQQGNPEFLRVIAELFNARFGWEISSENVAITNGGQSAFFYLFNLLGGPAANGQLRRIVFPLMPEYIGYAEQGFYPGMLTACPARIEKREQMLFKYHVDFDALPAGPEIAAYCISRPTNPTANVMSDREVQKLYQLARANGSLLMIDNAYGTPFPNIVFRDDANPFWDEGVVLTYSLSKLGLPGTRTGIVIAPPDIIKLISRMTSVVGLANGNVGQALTLELFRNGHILELCREYVRPFYRERRDRALQIFRDAFRDLPLHIHEADGALFLWLWIEDLPVTSRELYHKLKQAGVLVVPGCYFSHSLPEPWLHPDQCLRINHSHDITRLPEAATRMAEVVRNL